LKKKFGVGGEMKVEEENSERRRIKNSAYHFVNGQKRSK
jgi:hypothetical protein